MCSSRRSSPRRNPTGHHLAGAHPLAGGGGTDTVCVSMYIHTALTCQVGPETSTLPDREAHYFRAFLAEADPDKRQEILRTVSPEMGRALRRPVGGQHAAPSAADGRSRGVDRRAGLGPALLPDPPPPVGSAAAGQLLPDQYPPMDGVFNPGLWGVAG